MEVIFWNSKLIFTEKKSYVYKTKHNSIWSKALLLGIINAFDHMEFCLVLNLTMGGT